MHTHAPWFSHKHTSKTETEEKKLLNNTLLLLFRTKRYFCSFIKLKLNHCCHMECFNVVLNTFLGLEQGSSVVVYAGSESTQN